MEIHDVLEQIKKDIEIFNATKVKCGVIGRSGTGKSSLINAIVGQDVAKTGPTETTMEISEPIEHGGLLFYDLPGCGTEKFPKETYISEMKIANLDCVILVTSDRFYTDDLFLIDEINKLKIPIFLTRTKIDFSIDREERKGADGMEESETLTTIYNNLKENTKGYRTKGIYLTSADYPAKYDLDKMLRDIYKSLDTFKKDRFIADVNITGKEILDQKKILSEKLIAKYAALAALNGLNPIPGLDISVDLGVLYKMSKDIQKIYGIDEDQLNYSINFFDKKIAKVIAARALKFSAKYIGKEAIMILLKKASTSIAAKTLSKYIPFVGQAIAAGIGYALTSSVGNDMLTDAELIAKEMLEGLKSSC